jgi:hypothetical protein
VSSQKAAFLNMEEDRLGSVKTLDHARECNRPTAVLKAIRWRVERRPAAPNE